MILVRLVSLAVLAAALVALAVGRYRMERLSTDRECFSRAWPTVTAGDVRNSAAAAARQCGLGDPLQSR